MKKWILPAVLGLLLAASAVGHWAQRERIRALSAERLDAATNLAAVRAELSLAKKQHLSELGEVQRELELVYIKAEGAEKYARILEGTIDTLKSALVQAEKRSRR